MASISKPVILASTCVIIAAGVVAGLELSNTTHWFHSKPANINAITRAGDFSGTQQTGNNSGQPPSDKTPTSDTGHQIGGATDTGGQTGSSSGGSNSQSQPVSSQSGDITVDQPSANAVIASGDVLSGTAKVNQVQFTLIDNKVGVIARGTLNVVNGKFSGNLHFQTSATSGRLDIFSTEPNGRQINEVEIAVKF